MKDHDRRLPAKSLKIAEETIKRRLRGMDYTLYKRVSANLGVYTKGNEQRMGKGKGKFDYWTAKVPVSRIVFELKGKLHEKIAREAFRLAGHKLPGKIPIIIPLQNGLKGRTLTGPFEYRTLGIRPQGRSPRRRSDETWQWSDSGKSQAATQKPGLGCGQPGSAPQIDLL